MAVGKILNFIARMPTDDECKENKWPNIRPVQNNAEWEEAERGRETFGIACRACGKEVMGDDAKKYWKQRPATSIEKRTQFIKTASNKMVPVHKITYWECPETGCHAQHSGKDIDNYMIRSVEPLPRTHGILPEPPTFHLNMPKEDYNYNLRRWCVLAFQAINHAEGIYERALFKRHGGRFVDSYDGDEEFDEDDYQ